jgi:ABC-type lipoprotein export system ATPase subunit
MQVKEEKGNPETLLHNLVSFEQPCNAAECKFTKKDQLAKLRAEQFDFIAQTFYFIAHIFTLLPSFHQLFF